MMTVRKTGHFKLEVVMMSEVVVNYVKTPYPPPPPKIKPPPPYS